MEQGLTICIQTCHCKATIRYTVCVNVIHLMAVFTAFSIQFTPFTIHNYFHLRLHQFIKRDWLSVFWKNSIGFKPAFAYFSLISSIVL